MQGAPWQGALMGVRKLTNGSDAASSSFPQWLEGLATARFPLVPGTGSAAEDGYLEKQPTQRPSAP